MICFLHINTVLSRCYLLVIRVIRRLLRRSLHNAGRLQASLRALVRSSVRTVVRTQVVTRWRGVFHDLERHGRFPPSAERPTHVKILAVVFSATCRPIAVAARALPCCGNEKPTLIADQALTPFTDPVSGPDRALDQASVCVCVQTITFERNNLVVNI